MKLSDLVQTTRQNKPPRIVLHGIQKIGKSTWGAGAPSPIFIQAEDGLTEITVPHFPVATTLSEFFDYMKMLIDEENQYQTVVIDTVDWLEKLIWITVCEDNKVTSIEQIGYGKGYQFAMTHWDKFFNGLDLLRAKDMAIVVLAHNEIKTYSPPDGDPYDRFQIKLHKTAAAKLEEWADVILFAGYNVIVNSKSKKAVNADAERMIYTTNRPAWRAGSRYKLPDTLPMEFSALLNAIKNNKGE
jgi:hypothetical protein